MVEGRSGVGQGSAERGIILLIVLWVMIVLALLGTSYFHLSSLEMLASRNDLDKLQARLLADSAIELAVAVLEEESALGYHDLNSVWSGGGETSLFQMTPFGEGVFQIYTDNIYSEEGGTRYGLRDESSKININTADLEMLAKLPGVDAEMAAAIVDWRDSDETTSPNGAETEYYNNLDDPYDAANAPFESVTELLRVRGFSPMVLYGEDANRDGTLQTAEGDGEENLPPDNGDNELDRGLLPYITVHSYERNVNAEGQARLNLNTASEEDLRQRLADHVSDENLRKVIRYREKKKFENLVQLLTGEGVDLSEGQGGQEGGAGAGNQATAQPETKGGAVASSTQTGALVTATEFEQIIDEVTLSDEEYLPGRININTAPLEVLVCLPGIDQRVAEQIVERRSSELGAFQTVADLATIEGLSFESIGKLLDLVCVRSNVFEILAVGYLPNRQALAAIEAKIDRGGRGARLLVYRNLR
jgi:DNA uptake protein ComE-like DNA-binding protein